MEMNLVCLSSTFNLKSLLSFCYLIYIQYTLEDMSQALMSQDMNDVKNRCLVTSLLFSLVLDLGLGSPPSVVENTIVGGQQMADWLVFLGLGMLPSFGFFLSKFRNEYACLRAFSLPLLFDFFTISLTFLSLIFFERFQTKVMVGPFLLFLLMKTTDASLICLL